MKKLLGIVVLGLLLHINSYASSTGNYPGGFCYTGFGGPAYDGFGGPCYKTLTGFAGDCPKACRCKACKK